MNKLTLGSGKVLKLKRVSQPVLQSLLAKLTGLVGDDPVANPDALVSERLDTSVQMEVLKITNQLYTYCAGWGVKNSPNGETSELSELLGVDKDKPHLRRASWVLHELCQGDEDHARLLAAVMTYTFAPKKKKAKKKKKKKVVLDEEIIDEDLEERLAGK